MSSNLIPITGTPLYTEGMAHLQAGEWQEAIRCFQELARQHPGNPTVEDALEMALFKAGLEAQTEIKAKRWAYPWQPLLFRSAVAVVVAVLLFQGFVLASRYVMPVIAEARQEKQLKMILAEGYAFLEAGNLDQAEANFRQVLSVKPEEGEALAGLNQVIEQRALLAAYRKAVALEEAEEYQAALEAYNDILVQAPGYRDVSDRIVAIQNRQQLDELFALAETYRKLNLDAKALDTYQQIQEISVHYKSDTVRERLFDLYLKLGRQILQQEPPAPEQMPLALDYFQKALSLEPANDQAILEHRLATLYLDGKEWYDAARWDDAVLRLRGVYDQRPDYLGGILAELLYDAYVRSGDQHRESGDVYFAYEQYRKAAALPVSDTALAEGRIAQILPSLTPTPTPTATPTITPTPIPVPPTPTPTPRPLAAYHNRIVFRSNNEDQPGFWVMDPDGSNRQYLGDNRDLRRQYEELVTQAQFSPDGRYRAFVQERETAGGKIPQIYIDRPPHPTYGPLPPKELTTLTGMSYDPAWSPDGSRIAFVSQELGGDDIWIIYVDGSNARALTQNTWEWDKHPSWSPDSSRIVFWSNRDGLMQIYVMDADGRNVRNISNVPWDEYDPIWVR